MQGRATLPLHAATTVWFTSAILTSVVGSFTAASPRFRMTSFSSAHTVFELILWYQRVKKRLPTGAVPEA